MLLKEITEWRSRVETGVAIFRLQVGAITTPLVKSYFQIVLFKSSVTNIKLIYGGILLPPLHHQYS